jgi:hypothetical protein
MSTTIESIDVGDEPASWRAAGFSVDDDGTCRVGQVRVRLLGREGGKRILGWSLRGIDRIDALDVDGLRTDRSNTPPCEPATHANGVTLIDHVVLVTPDTARTTAALGTIGLEPRRTRETDQYGPPFVQTFFKAGEVIVELIGPQEPNGDGPAAFFGLAYTVDDLDATKELLGDLLGQPKDAVQPGRRIATLRHKPLDVSVATAFMSR